VAATAGLAKAAIKVILELVEYQKSIAKEVDGLDRMVKAGTLDVGDAVDRRALLVGKLDDIMAQIRRKRGELGVSDRANLKKMESSQYLKVRFGHSLTCLESMTVPSASDAGKGPQGSSTGQASKPQV
jgi:hypothetical protein